MLDNSLSDNCIDKFVHGKTVLFITTKNIDYIRNLQEINSLKISAQFVKIIGNNDKSYAARLVKVYIKLLTISMKDYDIIFIGFAPQLILPFLSFRFKDKFIIEDFFISLYDTMVNDRRKFRQNSIFSKFLLLIDKITIKNADAVIVDTYAHKDYFFNELGADKSKINVLYLEADSSIYFSRQISKSEKYKDKFVVLYFGSILPLQGIDTILKCVESMENITSVFFQIIGPVTSSDKKKYGQLKNIRFMPWLSQQDLAKEIAKADLCLAGHFNNTIAKASRTIPGKAYIYKLMKKTMILGDNSANREIFEDDDTNYYYVEMGNPEKLKNKILYIMKKKNFKTNEAYHSSTIKL